MPDPQANVNTEFTVLNDQGEFEEYSPEKLNPNAPTYFITHGLTGTAAKGQPWQTDMVESIEAQQNGANVIRVTWDAPLLNSFANGFVSGNATQYEQSAANTQTVGRNIVDVISNSGGKITPGKTTLIGHSLGAQVSGWAGFVAKTQGLGEIDTILGLDPARPSFQESLSSEFYGIPIGSYKSPHQLNANDAERVVAIHTSQRFGITDPITGSGGNSGNDNALDIYVNGGSYFDGISGAEDPIGTRSHNYANTFFQNLLDGEGFDDNDKGSIEGTIDISDLNSPSDPNVGNSPYPLVSLNTAVQGNGSKSDKFNRGIVDVEVRDSAGTAELPTELSFGGTEQNDALAGTKSSDTIKASGNDDILAGLQQNDALFGGEGNDRLFGGAGDDTLTGVNVDSQTPGVGEIDILTGGAGTDIFVLGNANKVFYNDFSDTNIDDYALINDFEAGKDKIEVSSPFAPASRFSYEYFPSEKYTFPSGSITGGVGIEAIFPDDEGGDLIGIVENASIADVQSAVMNV